MYVVLEDNKRHLRKKAAEKSMKIQYFLNRVILIFMLQFAFEIWSQWGKVDYLNLLLMIKILNNVIGVRYITASLNVLVGSDTH